MTLFAKAKERRHGQAPARRIACEDDRFTTVSRGAQREIRRAGVVDGIRIGMLGSKAIFRQNHTRVCDPSEVGAEVTVSRRAAHAIRPAVQP